MGTQKKEKPSTEDLARERIVTLYRYKNKKLLLVCQAAIKGKLGNLFAALDKTGITLYEYKETYEYKVKQLETHSWAEWKEVLIDHYFIKSTFGFTDNNKSWLISFLSNRKEAQQIITNYTEIDIQVVSRPLYRKILGFRSWKTWKMITAIAMYVAILSITANEFTSEKTESTVAVLAIGLGSLALLGLIIGLVKPMYVLPFSSIKNRKRIGKVYGTLLLVSVIVSLIFIFEQENNQAQSVDKVESVAITKEENVHETVATKQVDIDKEEKKPPTAETPSPQPKPKQEKETTSGSCNIKGNISSSGDKIFHVPGGEFYNVTKQEEMFCSKAAAHAAGYRASKR